MYVLGPYVVGLAALKSPAVFYSPLALLFLAYFLLPANLLIYGINDIFDYETDVLNAKKRGYEALVPPDARKPLMIAIVLTNLPFCIAAFFLPQPAQLALLAFVALSAFYSAPPIRAKAKPFLDAAFNALYLCPGYVAYFLAGGGNLSLPTLLAGWAWVMAMQAYSAVPDITADKESKTFTVATTLGLRGTLLFCLALYLTAAALSSVTLGWLALPLGLVYATLMLLSLRAGTEEGVMKLYKNFPLLNTFCGMILFFAALLPLR
jgi:4-hydroxybenzoate polyprenyltransferase